MPRGASREPRTASSVWKDVGCAQALVTGTARGIGHGLVRSLLADGWEVMAAVRDPSSVAGLKDAGARVTFCDVSSDESVRELASSLGGRPLDLLVNNAGVLGPAQQSALKTDLSGFSHTLEVNTIGPLRVTQALPPNLASGTNSKLVNVSSRMGSLSYANSDTVAYRASKAALNKLTQCLATDLPALGIAVAAVHPGWVRTNIGGSKADIDVAESVEGLRGVIETLSLTNTGRFLNYDGSELDW
jgi:NAD(P)-dependent dehydrogenase (short-subunit alcohol dehydrogenase family)